MPLRSSSVVAYLVLGLLVTCWVMPSAYGQSSSSSAGEFSSSSSGGAGTESSSSGSRSSPSSSSTGSAAGDTGCLHNVENISPNPFTVALGYPGYPSGPAGVPAGETGYRCGCQSRTVTNVTTLETDSAGNQVNVTKPVTFIGYTYGSGRRWDLNAENVSTIKWDNNVDNAFSNILDIYNNNGLAPNLPEQGTGGTLGFTKGPPFDVNRLKTVPQCYGGAYGNLQTLGAASNCFDQAGADDANRLYCEGINTAPSFVKGSATPPICVVYGGGNRLGMMRFYPNVDSFALLTIQGSYNTTNGYAQFGHVGTAFQVELAGFKSPVRHRYKTIQSLSRCVEQTDPTKPCVQETLFTCLVVPFHTIVIKMTNGVIDGIEWDDDDSLCAADASVDGNCGIDITTCVGANTYDAANTAGSTDCDFKIYVSWSGTDSDGTYLSSSERRLSQFRRWSIQSVYNEASQINLNNLPTIPTSQDQ